MGRGASRPSRRGLSAQDPPPELLQALASPFPRLPWGLPDGHPVDVLLNHNPIHRLIQVSLSHLLVNRAVGHQVGGPEPNHIPNPRSMRFRLGSMRPRGRGVSSRASPAGVHRPGGKRRLTLRGFCDWYSTLPRGRQDFLTIYHDHATFLRGRLLLVEGLVIWRCGLFAVAHNVAPFLRVSVCGGSFLTLLHPLS